MRRILLFVFCLLLSTSCFAWGCPPWFPCGWNKNLIIPDTLYDGAVNSAFRTAGSVTQVNQTSADDPSSDIEQRIATAQLNQAFANGNLQTQGGDIDLAIQNQMSSQPYLRFGRFGWRIR